MSKNIHADLILEYAKDWQETNKPWERWEFMSTATNDWEDIDCHPVWGPTTNYRRKLTKKPVDLSVLIKSGIDCEFVYSNATNHRDRLIIEKLTEITSNDYATRYVNSNEKAHLYCKPRMNHWHYWDGGDCPLPEGIKVSVKTLRCAAYDGDCLSFSWGRKIRAVDGNIIAFKVLGLADGYCWPWEVEE